MRNIFRLLGGIVFAILMMSPAIAVEGNEGKVIQTIDAGNYTYVEISKKDMVTQLEESIWLASPLVKVAPGNIVTFDDGAEMRDFYSKTLDRTFHSVYFVSRIEVISEK